MCAPRLSYRKLPKNLSRIYGLDGVVDKFRLWGLLLISKMVLMASMALMAVLALMALLTISGFPLEIGGPREFFQD